MDDKNDEDEQYKAPNTGEYCGPECKTQDPSMMPLPRRPSSPSHRVRRRDSQSKNRTLSPNSSRRVKRGTMAEPASLVTPTVVTWVISAGVVVLFSAISFSAGYALGREVGRTEAGQGIYANGLVGSDEGMKASSACGKEAVKGGLRRLRWIGGGSGSGVSA